MPRFPTPDKFAMGYTPSPQQVPAGQLLLPPISPAAPLTINTDGSLSRSPSGATALSASSTLSSLTSFSSSSSEQPEDTTAILPLAVPVPSESAAVASASDAATSHVRTASRRSRSGRERDAIRESLMAFPSPPCSPRPYSIRGAATYLDTSLPYAAAPADPSLKSSKCSSAATPTLTCDVSSESHAYSEEDRPSLDEIMHAQALVQSRIADAGLHDYVSETVAQQQVPKERAEYILPELSSFNLHRHEESTHSLSMPPNLPLPQPPSSPAAVAQANAPPAPLRAAPTPSALVSPVTNNTRQTPATSAEAIPRVLEPPVRPRVLKPSRSTESFLGRALRGTSSKPSPSPLQTAFPAFPEPEDEATLQKLPAPASRRRRASLSIKIPKILSKLRKNEGHAAPDMPITPAVATESKFSPDSEGPVSCAEVGQTACLTGTATNVFAVDYNSRLLIVSSQHSLSAYTAP